MNPPLAAWRLKPAKPQAAKRSALTPEPACGAVAARVYGRLIHRREKLLDRQPHFLMRATVGIDVESEPARLNGRVVGAGSLADAEVQVPQAAQQRTIAVIGEQRQIRGI